MADSILGAWWERMRGKLTPRPCPYSLAGALEMPGRRLVAGPAKVLSAFGVEEGQRVVEIGPGTGFYSVEAARRVGRSGHLICIDLQLEMLRHTKTRIEGCGVSASLIQGNVHALPLQSGCVDHVFMITVLGEIPDRTRALAEIKRVLRPGGRFSVSEQFPDPDFVTRGILRQELTAAGFVERQTKGWLIYTSTWSSPAAETKASPPNPRGASPERSSPGAGDTAAPRS